VPVDVWGVDDAVEVRTAHPGPADQP
jgi:hypothetical protein